MCSDSVYTPVQSFTSDRAAIGIILYDNLDCLKSKTVGMQAIDVSSVESDTAIPLRLGPDVPDVEVLTMSLDRTPQTSILRRDPIL